MTVPATSSVNSASNATTAASTTAAANSLSYNDFLTMLMAEMKNQDPTQPMDPTAMVSQLATISQVGQAVQTNMTLASMLTEASLTQAEIAVGQTMTSSDGNDLGPGELGQCRLDRRRDRQPSTNGGTIDVRQRRERAMNEADALDLIQSAIWMIIVGAGPAVGAAMVVGVAIALMQALTQIQEMTLTFVPKIVAIFLVVSLTAIVHRRAVLRVHRNGLRAHRARLRALSGRPARRA